MGFFPEVGTGFEVHPQVDTVGEEEDERAEAVEIDAIAHPCGRSYGSEIVVPQHDIDTEGRSHALHETYTDIATRGLIRTVADDPMVVLTITVARMFTILALQAGASTGKSASTLQGRRYSHGSLPPNPALDGVVRDRVEDKRRTYLESGLRATPWVDALPHGEKMALLVE